LILLGTGTIEESFQLVGRTPVEIDIIKSLEAILSAVSVNILSESCLDCLI